MDHSDPAECLAGFGEMSAGFGSTNKDNAMNDSRG